MLLSVLIGVVGGDSVSSLMGVRTVVVAWRDGGGGVGLVLNLLSKIPL